VVVRLEHCLLVNMCTISMLVYCRLLNPTTYDASGCSMFRCIIPPLPPPPPFYFWVSVYARVSACAYIYIHLSWCGCEYVTLYRKDEVLFCCFSSPSPSPSFRAVLSFSFQLLPHVCMQTQRIIIVRLRRVPHCSRYTTVTKTYLTTYQHLLYTAPRTQIHQSSYYHIHICYFEY